MCNNCIHKPVCSKYIATGGVNKCEHYKEGRKGRWEKSVVIQTDTSTLYNYTCSMCSIVTNRESNYCPNCGADMRGTTSE